MSESACGCTTICNTCDKCTNCCECLYCEGCTENTVQEDWCSGCDRCKDCCDCWYCESCEESYPRGGHVGNCPNCELCDNCCECRFCGICEGKVLDDDYCDECDRCNNCCKCEREAPVEKPQKSQAGVRPNGVGRYPECSICHGTALQGSDCLKGGKWACERCLGCEGKVCPGSSLESCPQYRKHNGIPNPSISKADKAKAATPVVEEGKVLYESDAEPE